MAKITKGFISKFGNVAGGNYSEFESDGTYQAVGNARTYRDELGDVTTLKVAGVGISQNATEGTVEFQTSANLSDYLYTNVQLNHDRDLIEKIYPHLHWLQSENHVPNFLLVHRWHINGGTKTTTWTSVTCNTTETAYVTGTIHQICATANGITPPTGTNISDIVQFKILRDNANNSGLFSTTDSYTVDVGVMAFDVHVITNTLGSREEYTK